MSINNQWPDFGPDPDVTIDVTAGTLKLAAGAVLANVGDFDVVAPDISCALWKSSGGGAFQQVASVAIAANGALTMTPTSVQVQQTDNFELRFTFVSPLSLPWLSRLTWERVLAVTGANGSTHFAKGATEMPIPNLEIAFGWENTNNKLRVGVKPTSANGATQALQLSTRLVGGGSASTTNVNLSSQAQQTHDSVFTYPQATAGEAEMELFLPGAANMPRQLDRVKLVFQVAASVPAWNAAAVLLEHEKIANTDHAELHQ